MLFRRRKRPGEIKEMRWEILQMIADWLGCRQMEDALHISEANIRYHLRNIYRELKANGITNAVSLFEKRKYTKLLSALKELSKKDHQLAALLKQFNML